MICRSARFWSRHLVLLNVALFIMVWLLYGSPALHGYGRDYAARALDVWLTADPTLFDHRPGIENVLVPGLAAALRGPLRALGWDAPRTTFLILTIVPYPLFIYGFCWHIRRNGRGNPLIAAGAALTLYTSGMIPYMTSWGGYLDGMSYLVMLPVLIWPASVAVYAAAFALECLNHYLGAVALLLLAFTWSSWKAVNHAGSKRERWQHWFAMFAPRLAVSGIILGGFLWFWEVSYPEANHVRWTILAEKWRDPAGVIQEVAGEFPFTLLSTVKLAVIPIFAVMVVPARRRHVRALLLAFPFAVATFATLIFVDVTRVATMLVLPALVVTLDEACGDATPRFTRLRLRNLLLSAATANLLIPNYYVNNGRVAVPPSTAVNTFIETIIPRDADSRRTDPR